MTEEKRKIYESILCKINQFTGHELNEMQDSISLAMLDDETSEWIHDELGYVREIFAAIVNKIHTKLQ